MRVPARMVFLAAVLGAMPARADPWTLPPLDGEMGGEFEPASGPGAPLQWRITAQRIAGNRRDLVVTLHGGRTHLRVEARVTVGTGDGEWKITEANLDAGRWFAAVAPQLGKTPAGWVAEGTLTLAGAGRLHAGQPSGTVGAHGEKLELRDAAGAWTLKGISLDAEFAFDAAGPQFRSTRPLVLGIDTITTKRFGAQNLKVTAQLTDLSQAELLSATLEIAGGQVVAAPGIIPLRPPNVAMDLRFTHIGLQDIAQFVPDAVAEAYGMVDGFVRLGWTPAGGLSLGDGRLTMRKDAPAVVRFVQLPGMITANIPRNVGAYMALYDSLHQVEMGRVPIEAESLEVTFTPNGDAEGRQAHVHVIGRIPGAPSPLDLTVNVRGPIGALLKMSTDSRLHFGGTGK